jgi:hypothetical protein
MVPVALGIAALMAGSAYAIPAARTAVGGIGDSLAGWVSGDDNQAPGRAVKPSDDAPTWFGTSKGEVRLIAETEGLGLYVRRVDSQEGPGLEFWLGEGRGMGGTLESWRQRLGERGVVVLDYAPFGRQDVLDERGRVPLYGLTTRDVRRVEILYAEGPHLVGAAGDGGFVLLADAWRPMREIVAYDGEGRVVARSDASRYDLRYLCDKDPGACPPEASSGSR